MLARVFKIRDTRIHVHFHDFEESDHPRGKGGEFTSGSSSKTSGSAEPQITAKTPGHYDIHVGGQYAGSAHLASPHPFISAVQLEPGFQRHGIGHQLYDKIEKDIGRRLVPSPLGLTEAATSFWQKRFKEMGPQEAKKLLDEAHEIGLSYGIKEEHIASRLNPLRSSDSYRIGDTKVFLHFHDDFDPQEERDPSGKWTKGGGGETAKVKLERKPRRGSISASFEPLEKKEVGEKKKPDTWTLPGGKPLPRHIQKLLGYKRIPPKWTKVRYNPDPKGELLIVGCDDKNRQQPLYSEKHDKSAAADKFNRSQRLDGSKFDSVMAKNNKCKSSTNPKVRDMASVLSLIMHTGIRPGSEADTKADFKSYGATTLEGRHVTTNEKGEPILRFVSGKKKGKEIDIALDDPDIAKDLQQRAKQNGPNAQLFPAADSRYMLKHVKSLAGASFKTKDFRTLLGTRVAATEVAKMPIPQSPAEYKKFAKEVGTKVSEVLGNTPAVALQSYIAPHVFAEWKLASGA